MSNVISEEGLAQNDENKDNDDTQATDAPTLRIVSLLPSITEVLSSLGVAKHIVGITHECDYPPEALEGAKIVTTSDISPHSMSQAQIHESVCGSLVHGHSLYGIDKEVLQEVQPDIVFTQSLCDVCAVSYPIVLETCAKVLADDSPKIISLEPNNLKDVFNTILVAGRALGLKQRAEILVADLKEKFDFISNVVKQHSTHTIKPPTVAFLEWHEPLFTGGHWIADLMKISGCNYEMCQSGDRSTPIKDEDFVKMDPDYILVGPCGFDLERATQDTLKMYSTKDWWKSMRAIQNGNVYALDGNSYFARPGPRLLQGCALIARCVHGEEVGKALTEELAPSTGMKRITLDMYPQEEEEEEG